MVMSFAKLTLAPCLILHAFIKIDSMVDVSSRNAVFDFIPSKACLELSRENRQFPCFFDRKFSWPESPVNLFILLYLTIIHFYNFERFISRIEKEKELLRLCIVEL